MPQSENRPKSPAIDREKVIVRTSLIGIAVNVLLAAFKAAVGLLAHSIAVVLDAVNNLSDALSSVITIIAAKLASRRPDKKHPLGHGRVEYLSAMLVAAIVLYAGITAAIESVKKIISPEVPDYSWVTLVIIASAIAAKLLLGRYVKKKGEQVNSGSLVASGSDALFDAILSASVLASAIVFITTGISLEAYVGVIIAGFIIKAGIEMLLEALDDILGHRFDGELTSEIKKSICEEPEVFGAYDLILHSYGPDRIMGSVHIEVPDTLTMPELDELERRIAAKIFAQRGVALTGIGIYSRNTTDDEIKAMHSDVVRRIMAHDGVLQIHGFHVDKEKKLCSLDIILDFEIKDRHALFEHIQSDLEEAYPDYRFIMTLDIDV